MCIDGYVHAWMFMRVPVCSEHVVVTLCFTSSSVLVSAGRLLLSSLQGVLLPTRDAFQKLLCLQGL